MNASRLPLELCDLVMDFARCDPYHWGLVNYPTLRACALVCHAWVRRARYNLFYRVVLRTAPQLKLFLDVVEKDGHLPVMRELQLTLPLRQGYKPGDGETHHCSLASPALARASRGVNHLSLCVSEWLYPRPYTEVLHRHFATVTTLVLFRVEFATGGDCARVLWAFPRLQTLDCAAVIVKFGGMATLPVVTTSTGPHPCRGMEELKASESPISTRTAD